MNYACRVGLGSILAAVGIAVGATAPAHANLEIEGYYWLPQPEGNGAVGIAGIGGTTFDVQDDLGFDDPETVLGATIIGGDRHQFGASFFGFDFSASKDIETSLRFSDLAFRVNTRLASSIDATVVRGFYRYRFGSDAAHAGVILGGQYTDFTVRASAEDIGWASATLNALFPVVGGFADVAPVPWLEFHASVLATRWDYDDTDVTFLDAEALVRVLSEAGFYAALGYRRLDFDGQDKAEEIKADVTFSGPVLFVGFQW